MDLSTVPMYFSVGCSVRENEIGRRNQGSLDSRDYNAPLPGWKMGMKTPYGLEIIDHLTTFAIWYCRVPGQANWRARYCLAVRLRFRNRYSSSCALP